MSAEALFSNSFSHLPVRMLIPYVDIEHVLLWKPLVKQLYDQGKLTYHVDGEFLWPGTQQEFWNQVQHEANVLISVKDALLAQVHRQEEKMHTYQQMLKQDRVLFGALNEAVGDIKGTFKWEVTKRNLLTTEVISISGQREKELREKGF